HVLPPSVVRNTPRIAFGPNACPIAATYAMSGFVGCTRITPMCRVSSRPSCVQVLPPSVERQTPLPCVRSSRQSVSPVPTQITFGSLGASAIAPTEEMLVLPSVMLYQVWPAFVVFQTPPSTPPK